MYVFTQPLRTSRMRHKINFEQSLMGLNSESSFSLTGCHTKVKEFCLPYNLLIAGRWKNYRIHTFPNGICAIWNADIIIPDLNTGHRVHSYDNNR